MGGAPIPPPLEPNIVPRQQHPISQQATQANILGKIPKPDQGARAVTGGIAVNRFRQGKGLGPTKGRPRSAAQLTRQREALAQLNQYRRMKGLKEISLEDFLKQQ